jgi:glycosyltransferase involved in cell wall biosynthesis
MIADMHRARHLAWELPKFKWDVEILAPDSSYQLASCLDEDSDAFFPDNTTLTFVPAFASGIFSRLGFGSIGWRAIFPMWRAGRRLLTLRRFDVVYISTTQFPLFLLGPLWRREFGIPYVLDFHDPCYVEKARYRAWLRPGLKHKMSRWISRFVEARAVTSASGIVSVSPDYIETLCRRYGETKSAWMKPGLTKVIPFAVSPIDLQVVGQGREIDTSARARPRIVYVGSGGAIMRRSFAVLCEALAYLRDKELMPPGAPRIELYGTLRGRREGSPKELAEVAIEYGVGDLVDEQPGWVSYRKSLELLLNSDGALILGVDDAGYMPSKLFTYVYSGKPLLALLRKEGPAFAEFKKNSDLGRALWFSETGIMPVAEAAAVLQEFLTEVGRKSRFDRSGVVEPFLARNMAACHVELFNSVRAPDADGRR